MTEDFSNSIIMVAPHGMATNRSGREASMSHEQTVKDVYAAFQRGDVAAIVERVADDVDWRNDRVESRECPWNGNFSGKTNLPGFFKAVGEHLDFSVFDIRAVAASGAFVAVSLRIECTVRKTGRPFKNDVVHFWTFDANGRIAQYRHYNDTAAELAAWRN
jgi:ketosteroid isomerase-like protein